MFQPRRKNGATMHIKNSFKIKLQRSDNPQQDDSTTYWKTSRKEEMC